MRFCQFCGAPLGASPQPPVAAAPPQAPQAAWGPPPQMQQAQPVQQVQPAPVPQGPGPSAPADHWARQAEPGRHAASRLVVITQDGSPGRVYDILEAQIDIGREEGTIQLPNDPYVSSRHARLRRQGNQYLVRDLDSVNGVYVRLRRPEKMKHGDLLLVGLEVLRFEVVNEAEAALGPALERGTQLFGSPQTPRFGRLCQRTVEGITRDVYSLYRDETIIGRESGDIVFTSDAFMSRQHAAITRDSYDGSVTVRDLGSSNGTYLAIRGEVALEHGDHLRIGQHLFRLEVGPE